MDEEVTCECWSCGWEGKQSELLNYCHGADGADTVHGGECPKCRAEIGWWEIGPTAEMEG